MICIKNGWVHDAVHEEPYIADVLADKGKITAIGKNPVSYTHLDVYKRQERTGAGHAGRLSGVEEKNICTVRDGRRVRAGGLVDPDLMESVSDSLYRGEGRLFQMCIRDRCFLDRGDRQPQPGIYSGASGFQRDSRPGLES